MNKGLLLINLGTPESPDKRSIRQYLSEFLADRRVITLPAPLRYLLLYCVILPFRSKQAAHAYQNIWTQDGSPLLIHSRSLQKKLQKKLGSEYTVALGMRYGTPSIEAALEQLTSCRDITILPLFPQYSSAATGSTIEQTLKLLAVKTIHPSLRIIRDFHNHPDFITAQATLIQPYLTDHDFILFSYHGLPEHHLVQGGCQSNCKKACPSTAKLDTSCYRAECFQTTHSIAHELHLNETQYCTSFQSRLGKTPWIKPYTDEILSALVERGIKRLAIVCPSFVADCLETLEEIGIRAKQQWLQLGGKQLTLIPSLNDSNLWVSAIHNFLCYTN